MSSSTKTPEVSAVCVDCKTEPPSNVILPDYVSPPQHKHKCEACQKSPLCTACCDYPLITGVAPPFNVLSVCRHCFKEGTSLDWSRTYDVIESENQNTNTNISEENSPPSHHHQDIIFLHGGGSSRKMFSSIAKKIVAASSSSSSSNKNNINIRYRCILPDLPGHGTRMDESDLSTPRLVKCVMDLVKKYSKFTVDVETGMTTCERKPILVGASFGGAVAMEVIRSFPDFFLGAVIVVACQNTGIGRGLKADVALRLGRFVASTNIVGSVATTKLLLSQIPFDTMEIKPLIEDTLQGGFYFRQQLNIFDFLMSVDSKRGVDEYTQNGGSIFLMNGEADHRDMEEEMMSISKKNYDDLVIKSNEKNSSHQQKQLPLPPRLKVYEKGTHFFSHEKNHHETFIQDIVRFCNDLVSRC